MGHDSNSNNFYCNKSRIFNDKIWSFDKKFALKKRIISVHRYLSRMNINTINYQNMKFSCVKQCIR